MKGLTVEIYKSADGMDCTNHGVTSKAKTALVVGPILEVSASRAITVEVGTVTVALGHKNETGDWIVSERVDAEIVAETDCPQIVVTPCADGRYKGYCLTHVQSGFFLLGGFSSIENALLAANKLAKLFPMENWDVMGQTSRAFNRSLVRREYERLKSEDKAWMAQFGGPRALIQGAR